MRTTILKKVRHSLLAEEDDLRSLCAFVASRYTKLEFVARCVDGSTLESKDINEILSFENPNYRRIRSVSVRAQNDYNDRLSLDIFVDGVFTSSELDISSMMGEQALWTSREILNRLAEMKPWYDLLARVQISYVLCGLWFVWSMWLTVEQLLGLVPPAPPSRFSWIEQLNSITLVVVIAIVASEALSRVQRYFFPLVFLMIGKQIRMMGTIQKLRGVVFSGVILAIIVGIAANTISNWLFR